MFKAWALVGARLYSVPLRVPRKFYVNSVLPPEDPESPAQTLGGLKVTRTLPFGREAFHIYEASSLQARLSTVDLGLHQQSPCMSPHSDVPRAKGVVGLSACFSVG